MYAPFVVLMGVQVLLARQGWVRSHQRVQVPAVRPAIEKHNNSSPHVTGAPTETSQDAPARFLPAGTQVNFVPSRDAHVSPLPQT